MADEELLKEAVIRSSIELNRLDHELYHYFDGEAEQMVNTPDTISDITVTTQDDKTRSALLEFLKLNPPIPCTLRSARTGMGSDILVGVTTTTISFERIDSLFASGVLSTFMKYASKNGLILDINVRIHCSNGGTYVVEYKADGKEKITDEAWGDPKPVDPDELRWYPSRLVLKKLKGIDAEGSFELFTWMDDPEKEVPARITGLLEKGPSVIAKRTAHIPRYSGELLHEEESVAVHSYRVGIFARAISQELNLMGVENDESRVAFMAEYHDVDEVFTGDLSQRAKYEYGEFSQKIREGIQGISQCEMRRFFGEMGSAKTYYETMGLLREESEKITIEARIVKIADTYAVVHKCQIESSLGNINLLEIEKAAKTRLDAQFQALVQVVKEKFKAGGVPVQLDFHKLWESTMAEFGRRLNPENAGHEITRRGHAHTPDKSHKS